MKKIQFKLLIVVVSLFLVFNHCNVQEQTNSMVGNWAFSLPDGKPAWLSIKADTTAEMLWSVGSPKSIEIQSMEDDNIVLSGDFSWRPHGKSDWYSLVNPITGKINKKGNLILNITHELNGEEETFLLTGRRMPPLPPKPDPEKVKFGEPINLLANGLDDWKLTNPEKINGWRFEDGVLINETPKKNFGAYGKYGNLQTKENFKDFELLIDYNVPEGGNSGIYLRGAYEVQVVDKNSSMQGIQGPGAVFGRIKPRFNNANPGGEWNSYRLVLVDRHITVELNGKTVIDNQPLEGCTGGGINADDTKPGPIFLQGDHTSVKYKNIILREVVSK